MSHSAQPVRGAHGSTRKVKGSAIMRKSPPPSISAMPNPPPGVKTGNTVLCAVSLASSVVVIEQPLRITAAASLAITVFPRKMPCWSGNDRRTTSSPCCSISLSALTAASNCSSFHSPWRSTKLCALRSCGEDTDFAPGRGAPNLVEFYPGGAHDARPFGLFVPNEGGELIGRGGRRHGILTVELLLELVGSEHGDAGPAQLVEDVGRRAGGRHEPIPVVGIDGLVAELRGGRDVRQCRAAR